MIAAAFNKQDGGQVVMLVLEPGNIEKLKSGQPIHKWLNEFIPELPTKIELLLAYTPDAAWVAEQAKGTQGALELAEIIESSLTREPVVARGRTAEEMKRII